MIELYQLKDSSDLTVGFTIVIDNHTDMKAFKELVQRGANLWPDAPASIKSFADLVTVGKEQQPYKEMYPDPVTDLSK